MREGPGVSYAGAKEGYIKKTPATNNCICRGSLKESTLILYEIANHLSTVTTSISVLLKPLESRRIARLIS